MIFVCLYSIAPFALLSLLCSLFCYFLFLLCFMVIVAQVYVVQRKTMSFQVGRIQHKYSIKWSYFSLDLSICIANQCHNFFFLRHLFEGMKWYILKAILVPPCSLLLLTSADSTSPQKSECLLGVGSRFPWNSKPAFGRSPSY